MRKDIPASPAPSVPRPLSRRRFLQAAGGLGALVVLGALPAAAEGATLPALTAAQLTGAMGALPKSGTLKLPGGKSARVSDVRAAAAAFAVADAASPDPATNPVAALGVLCALAAWAERNGTLDLSVSLPKAPVRPLRLALPRLPAGASSDSFGSAIPPALVVRPKASLILVGVLSGGRILAALEDPVRQVAGHPRLELVLLRRVDLASLLAVLRAKLDATGTVVLLVSGSKVPLRPIQSALASRLLHAAGVRFVDQAPIQPPNSTTPLLTAEPIVPAPAASVVPAYARISQAADGRVLALDAGGTAVARAMPLADASWSWVGNTSDTSYLLDYTPREYADAIGVRIGSQSGGWYFYGDFRPARQLFLSQVNIATIDPFYWKGVEPQPGVFDFAWADTQLDTWLKARMRIRGHPLVWGTDPENSPAWLTDGSLSSSEMRGLLVNHVATIVQRYRGRISEWVVVNEPYLPGYGYPEDDVFYNTIGPGYIDLAFETARKADPHARLILNNNDDEHSRGNVDGMRALAQHLHGKGLLDAVGLEMHMGDMSWVPGGIPTAADITTTIESYGIPCVVTEFDYDLTGYPGSEDEKLARQAEVYTRVLGAALDAGVTEISFWTLTDDGTGHAPGSQPALFTDPAHPKPAYYAVRDLFKQRAGLT
jgi:endo-1,4-beta-xylanase